MRAVAGEAGRADEAAKPGSPEFVAEFAKIMQRCDIVPIGPAPK
jgi:hypothetical protein